MKFLNRLARTDALVVDDWRLAPMSETERRDFLEVLDDRYGVCTILLLSCDVLPNIKLYACSRGIFCRLKKSCASLFGYIFFTAVRADHGRGTFNHKCRAVTFKSDSCLAWIRLSMFADGTFHVLFLLLKPGSHSPESGSYTVIKIVSSFSMLSATTARSL
jgi:hypothetical protein